MKAYTKESIRVRTFDGQTRDIPRCQATDWFSGQCVRIADHGKTGVPYTGKDGHAFAKVGAESTAVIR